MDAEAAHGRAPGGFMAVDQDAMAAMLALEEGAPAVAEEPPPADDYDEMLAKYEQILADEIRQAESYIDSEISPERELATRYYRGDPYGDEEEGRSQVVTTEVRDTVQAILPQLMRVFFASPDVVEFMPTSASNVEFAEQATDTVMDVITRKNDGFNVFYSAFKDGLVRKTGFVKWWNDEKVTTRVRTFDNVTEEQLTGFVQEFGEQSITVLEQKTQRVMEMQPVPVGRDAVGMPIVEERPVPVDVPVYLVRISVTEKRRCPKICAVPPEEIVLNPGARSIDDARIVVHRTTKERDELIAMGIPVDVIDGVSPSNSTSLDFNREAQARQPGLSGNLVGFGSQDENKARYEFREAYYRCDLDGDGISELCRFWLLGDEKTVVDYEPAEEIPLAVFCPDPEPHTWAGLSFADRTMDLQLINSHVLRNTLDSLAASIFPRMAFVEGQVNADDVLNSEIGAAIRMKQPGMVAPLAVPFVGQQALPIFELLASKQEQRTGISKAAMGLDASAMQSTNQVAAAATITAAQSVVELVARIYAQGFRQVMRGVLGLLVRHQDRPMVQRLRSGRYVEVDPASWDPEMDVAINVALGIASSEDKLRRLSIVMAKQEQVLQATGGDSPLVPLDKYLATLQQMTELAGFHNVSRYWPSVEEMAQGIENQPDPPPSTEEVLAEIENTKTKAKIVLDTAEQELRRQEMFLKDDRERDKLDADILLRAKEIEASTGVAVDVAGIRALVERERMERQVEIAGVKAGIPSSAPAPVVNVSVPGPQPMRRVPVRDATGRVTEVREEPQ